MLPIQATRDPALNARIRARHPLHYTRPRPEHPRYVRAASGLTWFGEQLAIVQDDALLVALVDPHSLEVEAVELPLRADGARTFDVERGNKKHKADFEACVTGSYRGLPALFAFGSGSHENRESIAVVCRHAHDYESALLPAHALYAALRALPGLLTSELNVEGAVLLGDTLRLFQRSNGSPLAPDGARFCATCDLSFPALLAHLASPDALPAPSLTNPRRYDLGRVLDARLTFTDAALLPGGAIAIAASAERSPNAYDDGAVLGSALGKLEGTSLRLGSLLDEQGAPVRDKVEGLALARDGAARAYLVFDPDDHRVPATLAEVELSGF